MHIDEIERAANDFVRPQKLLKENAHKTSTHVLFYSRAGDPRSGTTLCMESQVERLFDFLKDHGLTNIVATELGRNIMTYYHVDEDE